MTLKNLILPPITALISICLLTGCFQNIQCDNAETCVINESNDTVFYCWGCNFLEDTILPGDSACRFVGEISVGPNSSSIVTVHFESTKGNFAWHVDDCYVERAVQ